MDDSKTLDVPIIRLRPLREREVSGREYDRIFASIKIVGLLEPLVIFSEGQDFVILDGVLRYRALLELGVEVVPCIVGKQREAFTGNRMVNRVSPVQENRMIEKSLEELDEQTVAEALGIAGITHRLKKTLLHRLHADVAAAFDQNKITRGCAAELTNVKPPRQKEILAAMDMYKDFSTAFVQTLILKTPPNMREARKRENAPCDKGGQNG
jgi:ParB-like chromosome segregation protein Spo0J